jgi:hypothetical protein
MINDIHSALAPLAVNIDSLNPLEVNPRHGSIPALKASLTEFGQMKPIVVREDENGIKTIIAGNHTVEAAKQLGWTQIAAVTDNEMDEAQAIAFALVDNRVSELGTTDAALLAEAIVSVADYYGDVFESVGWDDFEIAAIESEIEDSIGDLPSGQAGGYLAPVMVNQQPSIAPEVMEDEENGPRLVAPKGTDEVSAVIAGVGGATSQAPNSKKAAIQYTLVFDDAEQMGKWWEFVRFLRSSTVYEGDTIAERLTQFIEAHADF